MLNTLNIKVGIKGKISTIWHELKRKAVHIIGLLLILALIFLDEELVLKLLAVLIILAILGNWYFTRRSIRIEAYKKLFESAGLRGRAAEESAKRFDKRIVGILNSFIRTSEKEEPFQASLKALLSIFLILILFGARYAIFAALPLIFGDAAAALVGKRFGKLKIPYNKKKSLEGSLAFLLVTFLTFCVFFIIFPSYAFINFLLLSALLSFVGAFAETIPGLDDNFSIPLAIGFISWALALYL